MTSDDRLDAIPPELRELLAGGDLSSEAVSRRLLDMILSQAKAQDPELARVLRLCALPRAFDAEIIGVLRDQPDDAETNARLLETLKAYSFVQPHQRGGYAYHDVTRALLLADWQSDPARDGVIARLRAFYLQRAEAYYAQGAYEAAWMILMRYWCYCRRIGRRIKPGKARLELNDLERRGGFHPRHRTPAGGWGQLLLAGAGALRSAGLRGGAGGLHPRHRTPTGGWGQLFLAGAAYYVLKDYAAALADFTRAIELQPEDGNNTPGGGWRTTP
jgi:tetratricopeptide (TPR) repeat protein